MSENKVQKTNEQSVISLDRFESLKDKINNQDILIRNLNIREAELKAELKLLKEQKEDKQPQVKITTSNYNSFKPAEQIVEYKNLPDLKAEALKDAEKAVEKELKNLKQQIEKSEEELKDYKRNHRNDINDLTYNHARQIKELNRKQEEALEERQEAIKKLEEEIQKLKANKTDEEIEKKRKEEIDNYKKLIKRLEARLNEYEKLNWFERIIAKFSNKKADEQAAREIQELKSEKGDDTFWYNLYKEKITVI